MAAPETGGELLAARVNAGGFLFGEANEAVMVAARAGTGSGRHQGEEWFLAGFVQPLSPSRAPVSHLATSRQFPASRLLGADEILEGGRSIRRAVRVQMTQ